MDDLETRANKPLQPWKEIAGYLGRDVGAVSYNSCGLSESPVRNLPLPVEMCLEDCSVSR